MNQARVYLGHGLSDDASADDSDHPKDDGNRHEIRDRRASIGSEQKPMGAHTPIFIFGWFHQPPKPVP